MGKWLELTINDVAQVFDGPHATPSKTEVGPWFLSISSLVGGRLILGESAHLSEADYGRWTTRVTPQAGDVLFSYETRLGDAALMPSGVKACLGRRMGLLRPKRNVVKPEFLLYSYLGPEFQRVISERAIHGATVDRIPLVDLPKWPIRVPVLSEQQAIAEVLGALDDKIALNERIAETSLALGRSVFRQETQVAGVETTVGNLATLKYGKALPAPLRRPGFVPVFGCTGQVGFHDTALTQSAHPVVGRKGANAGHVSWLPEPGWIIDTAFYAMPKQQEVSNEVLYFVLDAAGISTLTADSAVPGVNRDVVLRHRIQTPALGRLEKLAPRAKAFLATCQQAARENRTLADLRDTLLPQLVTGKIRVKDATRVVEEAV